MTTKHEKELFEELDRAMEMEGRRINKFVDIARREPKEFISHVWHVLSRVTKAEYHGYIKMVKDMAEAIPDMEGEANSLRYSSKGVSVYLHWRLTAKAYFTIAEAAGIDEDVLDQLIQKRAEEIYPPRKRKNPLKLKDYRTVTTDMHKAPKDKDTTRFFSQTAEQIAEGKIIVDENPREKNKKRRTVSIIHLGKNGKVIPVGGFDGAVFEAWFSLHKAGNVAMSSDMVFANMIGRDKRAQPTATMHNKILQSFRRMGSAWVAIEFDTAGTLGYAKAKKRYEGTVLDIKIETTTINGKVVEDSIITTGISPFVELAEARKQIFEYPKKLLDVPVSATEDTIIMRKELLRRIYLMKTVPYFPKVIDLAEVFQGIDYKGKDRTQQMRIRDKMVKMLDYWKKEGYIFNYVLKKKGKAVCSVEIIPDEPEQVHE